MDIVTTDVENMNWRIRPERVFFENPHIPEDRGFSHYFRADWLAILPPVLKTCDSPVVAIYLQFSVRTSVESQPRPQKLKEPWRKEKEGGKEREGSVL